MNQTTPPDEEKSSPARCENCGSVAQILTTRDASQFRRNRSGKAAGGLSLCELCNSQSTRREQILRHLIDNPNGADKRLIVAGPGTGKTYTFKTIIDALQPGASALVFTLINNLVDDLEEQLADIKDKDIKINTLHGYCKELLHGFRVDGLTADFRYYPTLPTLISEDAEEFGFAYTKKNIEKAFADISTGEAIDFYLDRASYYDSASHIDSVYRICQSFLSNPDRVPRYGVVIVDEFQDFNRLEASLVEQLSRVNPVLIAGDDDQALYGFRYAKNTYIRELYADERYEKHELPFSGRCTQVVADAVNGFVSKAQQENLLEGRIPREYTSYWPDKFLEQGKYPRIHVAECSRLDTVGLYVEQEVSRISDAENYNGAEVATHFMVIGPELYAVQLDRVRDLLQAKLDGAKYEIIDSRNQDEPDELAFAYGLLRENAHSNLGWRLVLREDVPDNISEILNATREHTALESILPAEYLARHLEAAKIVSEELPLEEVNQINPRIRILLTNYLGSKGLSANHTIVLGLNDQTLPRVPANITDDDACKFIVALTRARESCSLVTHKEFDYAIGRLVVRPSAFISWLPEGALVRHHYRTQGGVLLED